MQARRTMRKGVENILRARQVIDGSLSEKTKKWLGKPGNKNLVKRQRKVLGR